MSSKDCQEEEAETNQSGQGIRSNGVPCTESNLPQIQSVGLNNDEVSSSGEEFPAKIRKPYTITKQRERWTEEEHQKFLEALKLHGRAWRKIEEHIGTKTAVQIRSHAQKFFSKLEREALAKGVPVGKTQDIDIPPPRPKRKPSHPYPRKAGVSIQSSPTITEEENKSPPIVSSIPNGLSVDLDLSSPARKSTAFAPYTGKTESPKGEDISEEKKRELFSTAIFPSGLKLFGQTVVVPSDKSETNSEMKDASSPEVQASKEVSFQEVNNVQKSKAESINDGQHVDPDLKLQIHLQSTNTDGSNMLEGSGESNTNLASMENNIFESPLEANHSVCHSGNNPCSSFSVPRPVPVMFVEGTTMERETLKTGLSITSLAHDFAVAHDFAAFNMLTSAGSSSNASDKVPTDFQASAVPNFLLPFSGVAGAFNPAVHSPEKFPNIHGFLTHCSPPNCPIPSWPFAPSSTLHHPTYAAATLAAAAFWPGMVPGLSPVDLSQRSESLSGQYVSEDANTLTTVTAATVAAASAWWSLHGPVPPPFLHPGVYGPVVAAMAAEAASVAAVVGKTPHLSEVGGGCKADMNGHRISTKGEDCMQAKPDGCAQVNGVALKGSKSDICHNATGDSLTQNSPSISEHNATSYIEESCDVDITELEKKKFRKQEMDNNVLDFKSPVEKEAHRNPSKDRSSSGSNTPESETDPILRNDTGMGKEAGEKHCDFDGLGTGSSDVIEACVSDRNKGQSSVPQNDVNKGDVRTIRCHGHGDVIGRRAKPGGHSGDIWKSVSEEGRLAFQALFDQDVLPQSFSPRNKFNAEEPMQKDDIQSSASDVCQRSGGIELQDGAKVTSINHDFIGSNGMWREPTFSLYENNSQVPGATASDCSLECLIDSGRNSPMNDTTTSDCKQDNQSKISGNGNMRPGRAFVPYRRCSIEAKKDRLHSRPTQNCQEGAREEKRICLKQEVEEG